MPEIIITPREADQRKHDMTREEIEKQVEEFLANGGEIKQLDPNEGIHRKPDWNNTHANGLNVASVAHKVGIHFQKVYEDIREGHLDFYLSNGTKYVNPSDVPNYKKFVEARKRRAKK